jgi:hypothetical protein
MSQTDDASLLKGAGEWRIGSGGKASAATNCCVSTRFGGSAVARLDRRVTTTVQASGWIRMTIVVDNKLDGQVAIEFVYLNTVHSLYHRG